LIGGGLGIRVAGFTYLGVLFLIAAMGVAMVAASQVWHTAQQREKEEELLFAGDQIRSAIGRYYDSTPGNAERYPRSLQELLQDARYPGVRRYLRKVYQDPMTNGVEWGLLKTQEGMIIGVYSRSEAEPMKKAEFGSADRVFEGKTKYSEWVFVPKRGHSRPPLPVKHK
jgi:type II secretory pathway pseudopilin PulG